VYEVKKELGKSEQKNIASKMGNKKKKTTVYSNKGGLFDNLL